MKSSLIEKAIVKDKQKNTIYNIAYYIQFILAIATGFYGLIYRLGFQYQWKYFNPNWELPQYIVGTYLHFIFGPLWLMLGCFQFIKNLRTKKPVLHKYLGIAYIVSCLLCNVGVWFLAWVAKYSFLQSGLPLVIANTLSLLTLSVAIYQIKFKKNYRLHQIWMIRNYATACGAITLRLLFIMLLFTSFEVTYTIQCWLAYPIALVISELYIHFQFNKKDQFYQDMEEKLSLYESKLNDV